MEFLEKNREIQSLLTHGNTLVIGRLNYNDHGPTHSRISSIFALRILGILHENGIPSTIEEEHWGDYQDAQAVVLCGAYLHDIGNAVHRSGHHQISPALANPILREFLREIYPEEKSHRIRASILECILSHDEAVECLSIEAGCVTAGDGADMADGRARIPFRMGKVDIHAISALSIQEVRITRGQEKPVRIEVIMTESAGVFQIQEVLGEKLRSSGLRDHIEVLGRVTGKEEQIIDRIEF
jgi:metal-dependent HD superfamily phosphatase/phosphodiesterase